MPARRATARNKRHTVELINRACEVAMIRSRCVRGSLNLTVSVLGGLCGVSGAAVAQPAVLSPATMRQVGTIDERYQSYNVEMLEVTGGKFWRPYGPELAAALRQPPPASASASSSDTPAGMNPAVYEYRPPIDLTNP